MGPLHVTSSYTLREVSWVFLRGQLKPKLRMFLHRVHTLKLSKASFCFIIGFGEVTALLSVLSRHVCSLFWVRCLIVTTIRRWTQLHPMQPRAALFLPCDASHPCGGFAGAFAALRLCAARVSGVFDHRTQSGIRI